MSNKKSTGPLKSDSLREAAHELKTPIAAVRGFLELVQQAGELNELQLRYLNRAFGGLQRMETLIASILEKDADKATISLSTEPTDLLKLVDDAVELIHGIAHSRHIEIELQIPDDARYVEADARLLGQVLNNLLSNAVKYNHDGGAVRVQSVLMDNAVQVIVEDNGIGIPAEDYERIFEPFVRAHAPEGIEGSGLGLSIVATIIKQHGGRIWVEREPLFFSRCPHRRSITVLNQAKYLIPLKIISRNSSVRTCKV
jgi:two-component system, OmpR family, phosphate regulon sensor histidine kinase PhoR